ncbi:MAG: hypothetical protein J6Y13_07605 [Treponema sp.]|nr:hypothetical protein [Treponema sp.]
MAKSKYRKVIVIGYGTVAVKVLKTVFEKSSLYGYSSQFIDHEPHEFNTARTFAREKQLEYFLIEDKKRLTEHFQKEARTENVLVISANNNYLFPKQLVNEERMDIMNFHNALLPDYPGRNIASWVIYNREKRTGITWHYVNAGVDAGDIIIQKSCDIPDGIKAYELAARLMDRAAEAFDECFDSVLSGTAVRTVQQGNAQRRLYTSKEVPGGGSFSLSDSPDDIYRLLRAMDYGKNDIFPLPTTELDGRKIMIKRYKLVDVRPEKEDKNSICLPFGTRYLMLRYDSCI